MRSIVGRNWVYVILRHSKFQTVVKHAFDCWQKSDGLGSALGLVRVFFLKFRTENVPEVVVLAVGNCFFEESRIKRKFRTTMGIGVSTACTRWMVKIPFFVLISTNVFRWTASRNVALTWVVWVILGDLPLVDSVAGI